MSCEINADLLALIEKHEGFREYPYRCTAGKLTIGIGRNLEDVGITREEAEFLLQNDLQRIVKQLQHFPWYAPLSMRRKHALIDMAYNLGIGGLMNFRNMIACLERGEYSAAALHALDSKWAGQVGPRADRIAEMLRDG